MRRLLLMLAVVLVAAVVEVEAQGHGAPAAHAPKADPHAKADSHAKPAPPAKADPHAKPAPAAKADPHAKPQPAAKPDPHAKPQPAAKADPHAKAVPEPKAGEKAAGSTPDLVTVLERINKQVGTIVTDMNKSRPARQAVRADHAVKSPAPRVASHGPAAAIASTASISPRVELAWHTPLLVWPETLLRPEVSASRRSVDWGETAEEQVGNDQRHRDVERLAAEKGQSWAPLVGGYQPAQ